MNTKASTTIKKLANIELSLGAVLKSIRESEELSQEQFGKLLGVSKQYISAIERHTKLVSVKQAQRFAQVLVHSEKLFIQVALQDELNSYHINYLVDLHSAA